MPASLWSTPYRPVQTRPQAFRLKASLKATRALAIGTGLATLSASIIRLRLHPLRATQQRRRCRPKSSHLRPTPNLKTAKALVLRTRLVILASSIARLQRAPQQ
jgi:hypothetical protein